MSFYSIQVTTPLGRIYKGKPDEFSKETAVGFATYTVWSLIKEKRPLILETVDGEIVSIPAKVLAMSIVQVIPVEAE